MNLDFDKMSEEEVVFAARIVAEKFGMSAAEAVSAVERTMKEYGKYMEAGSPPPPEFRCEGCKRFNSHSLHNCVGFDRATNWRCQCACS